jgi:hypothetical protein
MATEWPVVEAARGNTGPWAIPLSNLAVPCVITRDCVLETELCGATRCVEQNRYSSLPPVVVKTKIFPDNNRDIRAFE